MDKSTITELVNTIKALQDEAVKQTLLMYKLEAERIIRTKDRKVGVFMRAIDEDARSKVI